MRSVGPTPRRAPPARAAPHSPAGRGGYRRPRLWAPARPSADAGEHPPALTRQCAHPGAGGAGRPSVCPEVAGTAEQGRRRGRGERGDQQEAPGRARRRGARRQRSSLGSVVRGGAPRPRGGGTPRRVLPCRCPLPESTSRPVTALPATRTSALGKGCAGSFEKLGATDRVGRKGFSSL